MPQFPTFFHDLQELVRILFEPHTSLVHYISGRKNLLVTAKNFQLIYGKLSVPAAIETTAETAHHIL